MMGVAIFASGGPARLPSMLRMSPSVAPLRGGSVATWL